MVVAGGYTDLMDILASNNNANYHECTIAIDPVAGFIAGTWDSHPSAIDSLIVLQRHPTNGLSTLALTTAGWPCQQGVNSSGVGFAITNLTPRVTDKSGLVYIAANAALGSANSLIEIVNRFKNEKFCSGHSYVIVDGNGGGSVLETTSEAVSVMPILSMSIKANHYRGGEDAIDDNCNYSYLHCSIERESELAKNISSVTNSNEFVNCLINSPSVNRKDSKGPSVTCAHFFVSAKEKSLWYSKGPAAPSSRQNSMLFRQLLNEKYQ
jgi:predicted choloylglycine hydrolase